MMLSEFWAHFICRAHEKMKRCRGKHSPSLCFADFPWGVSLRIVFRAVNGLRRGRCRLACARSSAYARPSCLDERTAQGGEDCQSRSDCSVSLSLSLLLSDQIQPPNDKLLRALPVLIIQLLKCRPPQKKINKIKLNGQQAVEGWDECEIALNGDSFFLFIYLITNHFPTKTWGTSGGQRHVMGSCLVDG